MKSRGRIDPAYLEQARQVADAILYEGYLLYPYRASAQKNQERFQFGVLMPAAYRAVDEHEPSAAQTECLLECADATVTVVARFLQVQRRRRRVAEPAPGSSRPRGTRPPSASRRRWPPSATCSAGKPRPGSPSRAARSTRTCPARAAGPPGGWPAAGKPCTARSG